MESSIFKYILKYTAKDQAWLILLAMVSMPFVYLSLEIPKIIINDAIGGANIPDTIFGYPVDRISYLILLSAAFLLLILVNGGFKYVSNMYRGIVGERMLRRFRFELYARLLRFPLPHFKRTSAGEVIPMITAETEPLGGFIGDAFALPAFQGGLFVTYLGFIFAQDFWLGLAAVALFPPQMWLIPRLQRRVNALMKERVRTVRKLSDRVGESVNGISAIHAHDTSRYERAHVASQLDTIYNIRYLIYKKKFFIKFINNFLALLTPFFFYLIGGYLVIKGDLTLGALVAVLAAYKDITSPWKELLKFYQIKEDVKVKYAQIIEQFQPDDMLSTELQEEPEQGVQALTGELTVQNLIYTEDNVVNVLERLSLKMNLADHIGILGTGGSGKDELSRLLARLIFPSGGSLKIAGENMEKLSQAVSGRRIGYVGPSSSMFAGCLYGNLTYALKHRPGEVVSNNEHAEFVKNALASGNTTDHAGVDWIDYAAAQVADASELQSWAIECLQLVELEEDVFMLGLLEKYQSHQDNEFEQKVLQARQAVLTHVSAPDMPTLVEFFDANVFNTNMTVAENIVFGAPLQEEYKAENLAENVTVAKLIEAADLKQKFQDIGKQIAEIMLELFADVSPDSELFEQFSFIKSDDLPEFQLLLNRARGGKLSAQDERMLFGLVFKLIPSRHRLGLVDDTLSEQIVNLRKQLRQQLGEGNEFVEFFAPEKVNTSLSIQDNILFGRIAYGQANAQLKVIAIIREIVEKLDLNAIITRAGFNFEVGSGGARLSLAQRQKLGLARCLIKRPDLLIVNESLGMLDAQSRHRILNNVRAHMQGRGVIWLASQAGLLSDFDRVLIVDQGRLIADKPWKDLQNHSADASRVLAELS